MSQVDQTQKANAVIFVSRPLTPSPTTDLILCWHDSYAASWHKVVEMVSGSSRHAYSQRTKKEELHSLTSIDPKNSLIVQKELSLTSFGSSAHPWDSYYFQEDEVLSLVTLKQGKWGHIPHGWIESGNMVVLKRIVCTVEIIHFSSLPGMKFFRNLGAVTYLSFFTIPYILLEITLVYFFFFFNLTKLPWWLIQQRICLQCGRPRFCPWVRKMLWRREWLLTSVFLSGEFHGQRSLPGCSPWGHKESNMTAQLSLSHTFLIWQIGKELYSECKI